eukprot:3535308-Prorocentrum_lima.AAC.1
MTSSLVGSEMCIRDSPPAVREPGRAAPETPAEVEYLDLVREAAALKKRLARVALRRRVLE